MNGIFDPDWLSAVLDGLQPKSYDDPTLAAMMNAAQDILLHKTGDQS